MFLKMILLLIALISLFSHSTALYNVFNCSLKNYSVNETTTIENVQIFFKYYRHELYVYEYFKTPSVNLFLDNPISTVKFATNGYTLNTTFQNYKNSIEIVGVANLLKEDLKDCQFFVADKISGRMSYDPYVKAMEQCLNLQLCNNLGVISDEDTTRGEDVTRNFGPISIESPKIQIRFPKIEPTPYSLQNKYEKVANVMTSQIIVKSKENYNNTIVISHPNNSTHIVTNNLFESSTNVQRFGDVYISSTNNFKILEFNLVIANVSLKSSVYENANLINLICGNLENLTFSPAITLDTNDGCKPSLLNLSTEIPNKLKIHNCSANNTSTDQSFIDSGAIVNDVVEHIKKQIKQAIEINLDLINKLFDCVEFKDSLYHE